MADIAIRMGVNAPEKDVDGVLTVFDIINKQDPQTDDEPFAFSAYEENFTDGAIGVLASMSVVINYIGQDGSDKTFTEHILQSFERNTFNGKPIITVGISSRGRKLIRLVYEQRDREDNDVERSRYIQMKAEEIGLL